MNMNDSEEIGEINLLWSVSSPPPRRKKLVSSVEQSQLEFDKNLVLALSETILHMVYKTLLSLQLVSTCDNSW